jgi:AcrR family transcriptional regulator
MIDAAIRVLGETPDASMQEVATASGVGRATLYRYFSTRDDLVRAIRLRALRDCREALAPGVLERESPREALGAAVGALLPVLDRYRVLIDAPLPDRSDPEQRALVEAVERPLIDLIRRAQERGELDPRFPPAFAFGVMSGVLKAGRAAIAAGEVSPERAHPLAVRALLAGLGAGGPEVPPCS